MAMMDPSLIGGTGARLNQSAQQRMEGVTSLLKSEQELKEMEAANTMQAMVDEEWIANAPTRAAEDALARKEAEGKLARADQQILAGDQQAQAKHVGAAYARALAHLKDGEAGVGPAIDILGDALLSQPMGDDASLSSAIEALQSGDPQRVLQAAREMHIFVSSLQDSGELPRPDKYSWISTSGGGVVRTNKVTGEADVVIEGQVGGDSQKAYREMIEFAMANGKTSFINDGDTRKEILTFNVPDGEGGFREVVQEKVVTPIEESPAYQRLVRDADAWNERAFGKENIVGRTIQIGTTLLDRLLPETLGAGNNLPVLQKGYEKVQALAAGDKRPTLTATRDLAEQMLIKEKLVVGDSLQGAQSNAEWEMAGRANPTMMSEVPVVYQWGIHVMNGTYEEIMFQARELAKDARNGDGRAPKSEFVDRSIQLLQQADKLARMIYQVGERMEELNLLEKDENGDYRTIGALRAQSWGEAAKPLSRERMAELAQGVLDAGGREVWGDQEAFLKTMAEDSPESRAGTFNDNQHPGVLNLEGVIELGTLPETQ